MTLTRAHWLRSFLAALAIMLAPAGASSLWAQGADPFRPYNRQYDPYTVPMAPAGAEAGQFVGGMPRSGIRGANQYQNYLNELDGASREGAERYGIGLPYYKSAVDSSFVDPKGTRDYRPNREADRSYEQSQELVTQKYLAYFTEKDPKKRAALLKDYNRTRNKISRALSSRRESSSRLLDAASRGGAAAGPLAAASDSAPRLPTADRAPRASAAGSIRPGATRSIPPPPPMFGRGSSGATRPTRTPDDVLNRSRRLNPGDDARRGGSGPAGARPATDGRTTLDFPPGE